MLVIIFIAIIVTIFVGHNNQKKLLSSFDKYASYALYGNTEDTSWTNTNQSEDYISMDTYQVYQQFYSSSHDDYFKELSKLFNKFLGYYNSAKKGWSDDAKILMEEYIQTYNLLHAISETPKVDNDVILDTFLQHGKSGVLAWVESEYSKLKNISADGSEYFSAVYTYAEKYSSALELYQNLGCLKSNGVDDSCIESFAPTIDEDKDLIEADQAQLNIELTQAYLIDALQQGCWEMRYLIIDEIGGKDA